MDFNERVWPGRPYFDDVLLILLHQVLLLVVMLTRFAKGVRLNIPLVGVGMDTVTESRMAIAASREGSIGVIHKNMSIEAKLRSDKVKRSESGVIVDPISSSHHTIPSKKL